MKNILIPETIHRSYKDRVCPALKAIGVEVKTLAIEDFVIDDVWGIRMKRPLEGSVVQPQNRGGRFAAGDVKLFYPKGTEWGAKKSPVRINRVFGVFAQCSLCEGGEKMAEGTEVVWESHPMLVVVSGMVTILVDILPGKDTFVAVEIWPNAQVPMTLLSCRLGGDSNAGEFALRLMGEEGIQLLVECKKCGGSGNVECKKCEGSGTWQPDGQCKKCHGHCELTCPKCDGTGDFVGKYGDVMGSCRRCDGDGTITCYVCKGSGEPPILECNACGGSGERSCFNCNGDGVTHVKFLQTMGKYSSRGQKNINSSQINAHDARYNGSYSLEQGAEKTLASLMHDADLLEGEQVQLGEIQDEIREVSACLDRAIEVSGFSEETKNLKVLLSNPRPSTKRLKGKKVLAFSFVNREKFLKDKKLPIDVDMPLLMSEDMAGEVDFRNTIELNSLASVTLSEKNEACFVGIDRDGGNSSFLISFPVGVEEKKFPEKIWVKVDMIPPAELAQKKELARWTHFGEAPALLKSLFSQPSHFIDEVHPLFNEGIESNARQRSALHLMMSESPLVLIKGPPGTGKTTVITEAVLQAIQRNQRVLICSETHQAVCNVLEKLHVKGGIRMVRHGRVGSSKLSRLEKEYLEGGLKSAFSKNLREQVFKNQEKYAHLFRLFEPIPSSVMKAKIDAEKLSDLRTDWDARLRKALNEKELSFLEIDQQKKLRLKIIEKENNQTQDKLLKTKKKNAKLAHQFQKQKNKATMKIEKIEAKHLKKTGESIRTSGINTAKTTWLSRCLPYQFSDENELHRRWELYQNDEREAMVHYDRYSKLVAEYDGEKSTTEKLFDREIQSINEDVQRQRARAVDGYELTNQEINDESENLEPELKLEQRNAADLWNKVSYFSKLSDDEEASVWKNCLEEVSREIKKNNELIDFTVRWAVAIDSSGKELDKLFWEMNQVFFSTCVGLASWKSFHSYFKKDGVDLVIIDEAAHATLTQTLIPMGVAKRVALIGDEMQLPPAPPMELRGHCENECSARCQSSTKKVDIKNSMKPPMAECWLERSAFEWISEEYPLVPKVMLDKQFRMHPDIGDFVSQIFYEGELKNGIEAEDRNMGFGPFTKAVCLISTSQYKNRFESSPGKNSTSLQNHCEVEITRRILKHAKVELSNETSFGVVTPYSAQCILMRRELQEYFTEGGNLKIDSEDVASVDSFQGSERDVMIASFVRSPQVCKKCTGKGTVKGGRCSSCRGSGYLGPRLGWVHDLRRLNVAFSRARKMLILVGDIDVLTNPRLGNSAGSSVLEHFKKYVNDRGRVLHLWEEKNHE